MIKRLRRRFVLIAAGSLLIVELVIIGLINVMNFAQINSREEQLMKIMLDNGGEFPEFFKHKENKQGDFSFDDSGEPPPKPVEDQDNGFFRSHMDISEETRYQTRYFYIRYNGSLEPDVINTGHIAAVSSEEAVKFAERASAVGKNSGYIDNYRFSVRETSDGGRLFVFMDCREDMATKQRFLLMSAGISLGGYVLVCLLIIVLSGRAVKPFIENYEKQRMFITDAGHEIKTPLAIISANTEVIEMLSEPNEWTGSIHNQVDRLGGLVSNMLRLAKMDGESARLEFSEFSMTDAFVDIAEPFRTLAQSRGLSLDIKFDEGIRVNGDEGALRQVVSVFIENAVKYCDEGGSISAVLSRTGSGRHALIEVTNDCADPPEDTQRLFDRFYRSDKARARENGEVKTGYGIGLSMAKAAVEAHKGRIGCRTGEGKITFFARLRTDK